MASDEAVGDAVSLLSYKLRWARPSAQVRPLMAPERFSLITLMQRRACFLADGERALCAMGSNTPLSSSWRNSFRIASRAAFPKRRKPALADICVITQPWMVRWTSGVTVMGCVVGCGVSVWKRETLSGVG